MRYLLCFLLFTCLSEISIGQEGSACVNPGFEDGFTTYSAQIARWRSGECANSTYYYRPWRDIELGCEGLEHEFEIMRQGDLDPFDNQTHINPVHSGEFSARLNSTDPNCSIPNFYPNNCNRPSRGINKLYKTMTVTEANSFFSFWFAIVLEHPDDHRNRQPHFYARALLPNSMSSTGFDVVDEFCFASDCNDGLLTCNSAGSLAWRDWDCAILDLCSAIGQEVTLEFVAADCGKGAHFGYVYLDDLCDNCDLLQVNSNDAECAKSIDLEGSFSALSGFTGGGHNYPIFNETIWAAVFDEDGQTLATVDADYFNSSTGEFYFEITPTDLGASFGSACFSLEVHVEYSTIDKCENIRTFHESYNIAELDDRYWQLAGDLFNSCPDEYGMSEYTCQFRDGNKNLDFVFIMDRIFEDTPVEGLRVGTNSSSYWLINQDVSLNAEGQLVIKATLKNPNTAIESFCIRIVREEEFLAEVGPCGTTCAIPDGLCFYEFCFDMPECPQSECEFVILDNENSRACGKDNTMFAAEFTVFYNEETNVPSEVEICTEFSPPYNSLTVPIEPEINRAVFYPLWNSDIDGDGWVCYDIKFIDEEGVVCETKKCFNLNLICDPLPEEIDPPVLSCLDNGGQYRKAKDGIVEDNSELSELRIRPNPAQEHVYIDFDSTVGKKVVTFYDLNGLIIMSFSSHLESDVFDISALINGQYFVEVISSDRREVRKIIVLK